MRNAADEKGSMRDLQVFLAEKRTAPINPKHLCHRSLIPKQALIPKLLALLVAENSEGSPRRVRDAGTCARKCSELRVSKAKLSDCALGSRVCQESHAK